LVVLFAGGRLLYHKMNPVKQVTVTDDSDELEAIQALLAKAQQHKDRGDMQRDTNASAAKIEYKAAKDAIREFSRRFDELMAKYTNEAGEIEANMRGHMTLRSRGQQLMIDIVKNDTIR
jgi:hypothetical protein